jgi:hypothetical protein
VLIAGPSQIFFLTPRLPVRTATVKGRDEHDQPLGQMMMAVMSERAPQWRRFTTEGATPAQQKYSQQKG